ncbi:MAG: UDP-2,3-diacylglucosamine diphosphatase [Bacteroidales bacterium]|nr:UDP-2,3-diacylglucosamine diphosphatase [Bacteroidales bacterium]
MTERKLTYFVSDVHLGLRVGDPDEREERFVMFLKSLRSDDVRAVFLLGDIWDFWYEYRDVVPKIGARVVSELIQLMDEGIEVWFCPGNHDIWTYSFFESLGIKKISQPFYIEMDGRTFCLGHGDTLGPTKKSYAFMLKLFHNRFVQRCFSLLHPTLAYRLGLGWSDSSRRTHARYIFKGEQEPLYIYASGQEKLRHADYYIFGHYHVGADVKMPGGSRLIILKDWMDGGMPYACFDGREMITCFPSD